MEASVKFWVCNRETVSTPSNTQPLGISNVSLAIGETKEVICVAELLLSGSHPADGGATRLAGFGIPPIPRVNGPFKRTLPTRYTDYVLGKA